VVQAGDAVGLGRAARGLPGVEPQVVVVAARGEEEDVAGRAPARHVAGLEDHVEAHDVDVEGADAVDVRGAQMDVADADAGIDRVRRALAGGDVALAHAVVS
jgi:hypothetical protein